MPLSIGTWYINQNGFEGELVINWVDAAGRLKAKIDGIDAQGLWDEQAQRLTLIRKTGQNPNSIQVYTGHQFFDEIGTGPYLAGSFEAFIGTGASASRPRYGWWAIGPSTWRSIGPYHDQNFLNVGPVGGRVDSIDFSSDYDGRGHAAMYLATPGGGVWRSTDFKSATPTWTPLTDHLPNLSDQQRINLNVGDTVVVDPTNPRTIYAAESGWPTGILKSSDGGDTWRIVGDNVFALNGAAGIWRVLVDPSGAVYVAFQRGGYWRSTDGGNSWVNLADQSFDGVEFRDATYFVMGNQITIYVGVIDRQGNNRSGVWSWVGGNWTRMSMTLTNMKGQTFTRDVINHITLFADPSAGVYATLSQPDNSTTEVGLLNIFKLSNNIFQPLWFSQTDWAITQGGYVQTLCVTTDGTIYFGSIGLVQSVDGGKTFPNIEADSRGVKTHVDQHIIKSYQGKVYVGNDGGLWRFTPRPNRASGVDVWESLNTNSLRNFLSTGVSAHPINPAVVITGNQDNRIARRYATGEWKDSGTNEREKLRFDPYPNNKGKYAYVGDPNNGFFFSDDEGISFKGFAPQGVPAPDPSPPFAIHPNDSARIMIGWMTLYETPDRGKTWNLKKTFQVSPSALTYVGDKSAYVATGAELFQTFDKGQSWQQINFDFGAPIVSLCADPYHPEAIYVATYTRIFRHLTPAALWDEVTGNFALSITIMTLMPQPGAEPWLFVGTPVGVFSTFSLKGANTCWTRLGTGFPDASVTDLEVTPATRLLLAATWGRGAWAVIVGARQPCP